MILGLDAFRMIKPVQTFTLKTGGNDKSHQKEKTIALVLKVIKDAGLIVNKDLIKRTELASSTVYRLMNELESKGLVIRTLGEGNSAYGNTYFSIP